MSRVYNVLFLCTGNSARSILAECILRREGRSRFESFSAGSKPKGDVHPLAIQLLRREGFDVADLRSKDWREFSGVEAPAMDFVFTVCDNAANETCPVWPGQPISAHWGVPDPAAAQGTETERALAFADAFRRLSSRIGQFTNLPIDSLDRIALRSVVTEIGDAESKDANEIALPIR